MRHGRRRENRAQAGGRIARAAARAGPARREASRLHALLAPGQEAADAAGLLLSGLPFLPRTDRRIPHAGRPVSGSTGRTLFGCRTRLQQQRMAIRGVGKTFQEPAVWGDSRRPLARPRHAGRAVPQARGEGVHDVGPDARRGAARHASPACARSVRRTRRFRPSTGRAATARSRVTPARPLWPGRRQEMRDPGPAGLAGSPVPVRSRHETSLAARPAGRHGDRPRKQPPASGRRRKREGVPVRTQENPVQAPPPRERGRSPPNCWIQERFSKPTNSHSSTLTPRPAPG